MINPLYDRISGLKDRAFRLLQKAASEGEGWRAVRLSALIQLLDTDREELLTLIRRVTETEFQLDLMERRHPSVPGFSIQVTEGMISQKTLSLTAGIRSKVVEHGKYLVIDFGGKVGLVRSHILSGNNTLRARGPVRRFYEEQGIKAGDWLDMIQTRPNAWIIRKSPSSRRYNTVGS